MVWASGMPLGLFKGERTFTLAPQGQGSTEFRLSEEFSGLLLGLIGRSIPDMTSTFEQLAAGLKAVPNAPARLISAILTFRGFFFTQPGEKKNPLNLLTDAQPHTRPPPAAQSPAPPPADGTRRNGLEAQQHR